MKALNRSLQFFSNLKSYRTFAKYDRTFSHSLTSLACNFISCPPRIISSKIAKFHTTVIFRGKFFQEVENEYAHNIMKLLPGYAETISNHPLDEKLSLRVSDDADPESIFEKFFKATQDSLSANLSIEDSEFTGLICSITKSLPNASDEQILKTLQSLCMWPETASTRDANFKLLWNNLDEECRLRLKDWSVSQKLLVADYWFHLRLSRITNYNKHLIKDLIESINKLNEQQIVQLMFYINLQREIPHKLLTVLENKLNSVVNKISMEELGIICLGFFKTKNKIINVSLTKNIIARFISGVENLNTVTVAAMLKFFRKSYHRDITDMYIALMHKSVPHVDKWDIPTSVHLALLCSISNVFHPLLLNKVTEKLTLNMDKSRVKDGVKMMQCLSQFSHYPITNFFNLLQQEILKECREEEMSNHPRDLIFATLFFAYFGQYNHNLTSKVLDNSFVELCVAKYGPDMCHAFVEVDYSVEIECKDYKGPRLQKNMLDILGNRRGNIPSSSFRNNSQMRHISDIYGHLKQMLGGERVLIRHILPHFFSPDIIVRLRAGENSKLLSEICQDYANESLLYPPKDETWACFVISAPYSFAYKSKHMCGLMVMKLRQLQKLGYKIVVVPFYELPENKADQKIYIREHLDSLDGAYKKLHLNQC